MAMVKRVKILLIKILKNIFNTRLAFSVLNSLYIVEDIIETIKKTNMSIISLTIRFLIVFLLFQGWVESHPALIFLAGAIRIFYIQNKRR